MWRRVSVAECMFLSIAITAILIAIACAYYAREQKCGLISEKPQHDFGKVRQGQSLKTQIDFANYNSAPIEVIGVRKSCSCAELSISKTTIDPGDRVTLSVTWNVGTARGLIKTELAIFYTSIGQNEPQLATLYLVADVLPDFDYEPKKLVFSSRSESTQFVCVTPSQLPEVVLLDAYCTQRSFRARITVDRSHVEVCFDPSLWPNDRDRAELVRHTTSTNEPKVRIDLFVTEDFAPQNQ